MEQLINSIKFLEFPIGKLREHRSLFIDKVLARLMDSMIHYAKEGNFILLEKQLIELREIALDFNSLDMGVIGDEIRGIIEKIKTATLAARIRVAVRNIKLITEDIRFADNLDELLSVAHDIENIYKEV